MHCNFRFLSLTTVLCLSLGTLFGIFEPAYEGVLHEGYISKDDMPPVFTAFANQPPEAILEEKAPNSETHEEWIPGYWSWSPESKEFIWITGVWRISPPGMIWIEGEWKLYEGLGWVWLNGFWSQKPLADLKPIAIAPADPLEEKPGFPDSSNYFWNPGYWNFKTEESKYEWMSGNWELLDPNWILVPAHYEWRDKGFLFIPAYWDWPTDRRGQPYAPVFVGKVSRKDTFKPVVKLNEQHVYQSLIVNYPDYLYTCHHIYHFHPERWSAIAPTWWQWHSWWSLPWQNQWGLWWWYTHYGYPAPAGLSLDIAERIRSANPRLLQLMNEAKPPFVISAKGMVPADAILSVLYKGKSVAQRLPILPADQKTLDKIREEAEKEIKVPVRVKRVEREVEPSKRGKLHGIREDDPNSEIEVVPTAKGTKVGLPSRPILTPGQAQKATVDHDQKEPAKENSTPRPGNPNIDPIPIKELKEARHSIDTTKKGALPKRIPSPEQSIINQVLNSPKAGPPVEEEGKEQKDLKNKDKGT